MPVQIHLNNPMQTYIASIFGLNDQNGQFIETSAISVDLVTDQYTGNKMLYTIVSIPNGKKYLVELKIT